MQTAYYGKLEIVKLLLADPRVDYSARNNQGQDVVDVAHPVYSKSYIERVIGARNFKPEKEDIKARLSLFEEDYAKYIHHPYLHFRREINEGGMEAENMDEEMEK